VKLAFQTAADRELSWRSTTVESACKTERSIQPTHNVVARPRYEFMFWRGRVALYAILKSLGITRGDTVIVPGYTCFAVPSAVCFAGATPLYADIEQSTFNVSLKTILAALRTKSITNVKAVLVQHTYGIPADTQPIVSWAREHSISTIEDCAHVQGSRYCNGSGELIPVGTLADAAFFSSQWTKPVSTGLGGWAVTSDPTIFRNIERFRMNDCISPKFAESFLLLMQVVLREMLSHPRMYENTRRAYQALYKRGLLVGTSSKEELHGHMPAGYAKRMSLFQNLLLRRRLANAPYSAHRRGLKQTYDALLEAAGLPVLRLPPQLDAVLLRYPLRVRSKQGVLAEAKKSGIALGDWYSHPIDRPDSLEAETVGYRTGDCPEAERTVRDVINLPMGPDITEKKAAQIVNFLRDFE